METTTNINIKEANKVIRALDRFFTNFSQQDLATIEAQSLGEHFLHKVRGYNNHINQIPMHFLGWWQAFGSFSADQPLRLFIIELAIKRFGKEVGL